jgi:hypothetical protein
MFYKCRETSACVVSGQGRRWIAGFGDLLMSESRGPSASKFCVNFEQSHLDPSQKIFSWAFARTLSLCMCRSLGSQYAVFARYCTNKQGFESVLQAVRLPVGQTEPRFPCVAPVHFLAETRPGAFLGVSVEERPN